MDTELTLSLADVDDAFLGFESLDANFIYCPNQYFDYCLRYGSRKSIRLVSYVMHETLRWRDSDGNPITQDIAVTHSSLVTKAKISKGSIKPAATEALELHLLRQVSQARAKAKGVSSSAAQYALCWDDGSEYKTAKDSFRGFFSSAGNRTPVPAQFFTVVVPNETVAVTKVVGAVLRFTVGYETQFGRKQEAALSLTRLQEITGISDRTTLIDAIRTAIDRGYIACVQAGVFSSDVEKQKAATYAIKWLKEGQNVNNGTKRSPEYEFKKPTRKSVQVPNQKRFKTPTTNGSISPSATRFKKPTNIKKTQKETNKQQTVVALMKEGFSSTDAQALATNIPRDVIARQIDWLPFREASSNRIGLLRKAIVEDWSMPAAVKKSANQSESEEKFRKAVETTRQTVTSVVSVEEEIQAAKRQRYDNLLTDWKRATNNQREAAALKAYNDAPTAIDKQTIEQALVVDVDNPPPRVLDALEAITTLPTAA